MKFVVNAITAIAMWAACSFEVQAYRSTSNPSSLADTIKRTFVGCSDLEMTSKLRQVSAEGNQALQEYMADNHVKNPDSCRGFIVSISPYSSKLCEDFKTSFEDCSVKIKIADQVWFIVLPAFAEPVE